MEAKAVVSCGCASGSLVKEVKFLFHSLSASQKSCASQFTSTSLNESKDVKQYKYFIVKDFNYSHEHIYKIFQLL